MEYPIYFTIRLRCFWLIGAMIGGTAGGQAVVHGALTDLWNGAKFGCFLAIIATVAFVIWLTSQPGF